MEYTEKWFYQQKEAMLTALIPKEGSGKDILQKISEHVDETVKRKLKNAFSEFLVAFLQLLDEFHDSIKERLPIDYETTAADLALRDTLKKALPDLKDRVSKLEECLQHQTVKRELKVDGDHEEPVAPKVQKV